MIVFGLLLVIKNGGTTIKKVDIKMERIKKIKM